MKKLMIMLMLTMFSLTFVTHAQTTAPSKTATTHLKKDGTPDKRYKENKTTHLKKDGTPDKRYKENKTKP